VFVPVYLSYFMKPSPAHDRVKFFVHAKAVFGDHLDEQPEVAQLSIQVSLLGYGEKLSNAGTIAFISEALFYETMVLNGSAPDMDRAEEVLFGEILESGRCELAKGFLELQARARR
jgi:hypothetical protein